MSAKWDIALLRCNREGSIVCFWSDYLHNTGVYLKPILLHRRIYLLLNFIKRSSVILNSPVIYLVRSRESPRWLYWNIPFAESQKNWLHQLSNVVRRPMSKVYYMPLIFRGVSQSRLVPDAWTGLRSRTDGARRCVNWKQTRKLKKKSANYT